MVNQGGIFFVLQSWRARFASILSLSQGIVGLVFEATQIIRLDNGVGVVTKNTTEAVSAIFIQTDKSHRHLDLVTAIVNGLIVGKPGDGGIESASFRAALRGCR